MSLLQNFIAADVSLPRLPVAVACSFAIAFLPLVDIAALDWPQWRGPNRDGISAETGWSTNWPKEGLKPLWRAEVGTGYGSVAIRQGRLFVMGNTAEQATVYYLDASRGKEIWKHMAADGRLLVYSQRGQLGLVDATPDHYKELAFIQAIQLRSEYPGKAEKQTWAVPVLANGRIYCRSQDDLVCLDVH